MRVATRKKKKKKETSKMQESVGYSDRLRKKPVRYKTLPVLRQSKKKETSKIQDSDGCADRVRRRRRRKKKRVRYKTLWLRQQGKKKKKRVRYKTLWLRQQGNQKYFTIDRYFITINIFKMITINAMRTSKIISFYITETEFYE